MTSQFPFTLLISAHDEELTPVIQAAISKFIQEIAKRQYPDAHPARIEHFYRAQFNPLYEALALQITQEIKNYVTTKTPNPSGGSS